MIKFYLNFIIKGDVMGVIIFLVLLYGPVIAAFSPDIPPGITVEESLKDESLVNLAYSNPLYNNVGQLCYTKDAKPIGFGSVVYIGGKTCLTAAHCYYGPEYAYQVGFEIPLRGIQYYDVVKFLVHPSFKNNYDWDIAVLILATEIDGLEGLKPNYDVFEKQGYYRDGTHRFTYVGYGMRMDRWWFWKDYKRRAVQAYLWKHVSVVLLSTPYGYCNPTIKNDEYVCNQRPLTIYEGMVRPGMSGGGVFHEQYGLIGIMQARRSASYKLFYKEQLFDNNLYKFFEQYLFKLFSLIYFSNQGANIIHFSLSDGKEWIEDMRFRYDVNGEEVKTEPVSLWQKQKARAYYITLVLFRLYGLYQGVKILNNGWRYLMKGR